MKKLLALVLALMMALSCSGALAEATRIETPAPVEVETRSFNVDPGDGLVTITGSVALDADTITALIGMFGGASESVTPVISTVLSLVNNLSGKISLMQNGGQADLLLKDTPILSLAAASADDGFVAATDLVPNYLFTVSNETVQQLMSQVQELLQQQMSQTSELLSGIDTEALAAAVMPHVQTLAEGFMGKVGEPEVGEFTFEDHVFTVKIPVNITFREATLLGLNFVSGILHEEAMGDLFAALESATGTSINVDDTLAQIDELIPTVEEAKDEETPASLDIAIYSDEAANQYFVVDVVVEDQPVSVRCGSIDGVTCAHINAMDQVTVDFEAGAGEDGVAKIKLDVNAQGLYIGIAAQVDAMNGAVTVALFFLNPAAPVAVFSLTITPGAEMTLPLDGEGKTVVSLESLMSGEGTDEIVSGLMMDLQNFGLTNLMGKAAQLMPDEFTALMGLLSGIQ